MKLSQEQLEMLSRLNFGIISLDRLGELIARRLTGTSFAHSEPIPEKIPLTHFEILKLDAVFMDVMDDEITTAWSNERNIPDWRYCLTIDYIGAATMDDVVWLKLEKGA